MPSHFTAESKARRVGVVGPGLMGLGIAQALGAAGIEVSLCGRTVGAAQVGRERLSASLRRLVSRARLDGASEAAILSRVRASVLTRDGIAGCALVIESVPEDRQLKTEVLSQIEAAAPNAIVATNTSGLTVAGLAVTLRAPERFLGLHFFSPAERMPLVEVVRGPETAETTIAAGLALLEALGKDPCWFATGPDSSPRASSLPISTRASPCSSRESRRH